MKQYLYDTDLGLLSADASQELALTPKRVKHNTINDWAQIAMLSITLRTE